MARPRKEGKKAKGIYSKCGSLYIVISKSVIKDGRIKYINEWISIGLTDTDANIKKAAELRNNLLNNKKLSVTDKNIVFKNLVDLYLTDKKELSQIQHMHPIAIKQITF